MKTLRFLCALIALVIALPAFAQSVVRSSLEDERYPPTIDKPGVEQPYLMPLADTLPSGQTLSSGQSLQSANGLYKLTMQGNGLLLLRVVATNQVVWFATTSGVAGAACTMQANGYLVIHSGSTIHWQVPTSALVGSILVVTDDGHAVVKSGSTVVWSS